MVIVRRAAVLAALGVVGVVAAAPRARAGFVDLVLSAGRPGSAAPAESKALQFRNPSGSTDVAVTELGTTDTVQAAAGGGGVFFSGAGLPVLLSLADGSAYLASATAPDAAKPVAGLAASTPTAGADVPAGAALLGLSVSDPAADGGRALSVRVTVAAGGSAGGTEVTVPSGGWWVLGLGPAAPAPQPDPPAEPAVPSGPSGPSGGGADEPVLPPPVPVTLPALDNGGPHGPVSTPEPATLALVGLGLPVVAAARWRRRHPAGCGSVLAGPPAHP